MGETVDKEIIQRNEIVAILNNVRLKHLGIILKQEDYHFNLNGYITKADTTAITVYFDQPPDILPLKNVKVCFDFNRNFYSSSDSSIKAFNTTMKSIEVLIPERFYFHPIRRFARIDVLDNIELNINKVDTKMKEKSAAINIDDLPATLRSIYLELEAETPDIKKIISMIGDELARYSNRFKINLFKDLSTLTPIEKVVNIYKKTFWIGDTENLNNYIHLGDKYSIIGYEKYFELIKKTMSPEILEQIRQNYMSRGIMSYSMVPIIVGERVVGVIEVSVPNDGKYKNLTIYEIFYIKGLADILGEVVVKSQGASQSENANFKVLDISLGGILANTKNVYLTHTIKENSIVTLGIKSDEKDINIRSRVVRYHYIPGENAGLNVAFEFLPEAEATRAEIGTMIKKLMKVSDNKKMGEQQKNV